MYYPSCTLLTHKKINFDVKLQKLQVNCLLFLLSVAFEKKHIIVKEEHGNRKTIFTNQ